MLGIVKEHKIIAIIGVVLAIMIILPILSTIVNIVFNLGIYFGTIARMTAEGICCIKK